MIRFFKFFAAAFIGVILLTGCSMSNSNISGNSKNSSSEKDLTIVTSFYPIYIHAINIAAGIPGVHVVDMTQPQTGCLHDYQFTTDDLMTLENAGIFVINGAGMESFMDKVVKQLPNLKIVEASKGINLIEDKVGGQEEANPHVWVSVSDAISQVKNIGEQLAVLDPDNASAYSKNTQNYIDKLTKLKDDMHSALDNVKSRDIITFHEAFPYFAREFNLNIAAVIEREPGSEPSAGELADTIDIVKSKGVKALFAEPQYSTKAADTISKETGAKVYTLDPAVTGPDDPDAYINIMEQNLKVLEEALK